MDRLVIAFRALVRKAVETLPYGGVYPYSVESCDVLAQTVSARSLDSRMPDLTDVPLVTPGLIVKLEYGTQIKIGFVGLDPTAPYVAGYASGASLTVKNMVHVGWLGLSQVNPPVSTLTVVYMPWDTFPEPQPQAQPLTPTPMSPSPVFFKLFGALTKESL